MTDYDKICQCGHTLWFHCYEFFCVWRVDYRNLCRCSKFKKQDQIEEWMKPLEKNEV